MADGKLYSFQLHDEGRQWLKDTAESRGVSASEVLRGLVREAQNSGGKDADGRVLVPLQVPTATVEVVDGWADEQGVSRGEMFRVVMQAGFNSIRRAIKDGSPAEPGLLDRLGVPPMRARGTARQGRKER